MNVTPRTLAAALEHERPIGPIWVARGLADLLRHSIEMHEAEIQRLRELNVQVRRAEIDFRRDPAAR